MAFGDTAVLDNFDRANAASLGANWTEPLVSTHTSSNMSIASNTAGPGGPLLSTAYWNPATFGPDCEVYYTLSTKLGTFTIWARVHEFVSTYPDGYSSVLIDGIGTTDTLQIRRSDDGTATQLGATISLEFATGDGYGLECIGDQIAVYRRDIGVWSQAGVRTDATYNVAGNIGAGFNGAVDVGCRLDDFGGGTLAGVVQSFIIPNRRAFNGLIVR